MPLETDKDYELAIDQLGYKIDFDTDDGDEILDDDQEILDVSDFPEVSFFAVNKSSNATVLLSSVDYPSALREAYRLISAKPESDLESFAAKPLSA